MFFLVRRLFLMFLKQLLSLVIFSIAGERCGQGQGRERSGEVQHRAAAQPEGDKVHSGRGDGGALHKQGESENILKSFACRI